MKLLNLLKKKRSSRLRKKSLYDRIKRLDERSLMRTTGGTVLNNNQKKQVDEVWQKYMKNISYNAHAFYLEKTSLFSPYYIPDSIHFIIIDHFLNNWKLAHCIDNKCYYPKLFREVQMPPLIGYRLNGFWYDESDYIVYFDKIVNDVFKHEECFIKKATDDSYGGKGVFYFNTQQKDVASFMEIMNSITSDVVIQSGLKQSKTLGKLNESSVNTIRMISLLRKDGSVKIYSTILRMGVDGSKVDNASSGGITCGINEDGRLKAVGYSALGVKYNEHPTSHVHFDDIVIPSISKIKQIAYQLHPQFPHFRLISWDVALDVSDNPVLIEANLCNGEIDFHQLNNGPLFEEDTIDILEEVFANNKFII